MNVELGGRATRLTKGALVTARITLKTSSTSLTGSTIVHMKTITSTEAKAKLNAVLAEVERTGTSIAITNHGRPIAVLSPIQPTPRTFGQFPNLHVPENFDDPLPADELAAWENPA